MRGLICSKKASNLIGVAIVKYLTELSAHLKWSTGGNSRVTDSRGFLKWSRKDSHNRNNSDGGR